MTLNDQIVAYLAQQSIAFARGDFSTVQDEGGAETIATWDTGKLGAQPALDTLAGLVAGFQKAAALAHAETDIDLAAERARLRFLTPGSGQALEYQQTGDEAAAAKAAIDGGGTPVADDYPMLKAELDAQVAAGVSPTPTFTDIINQIVATPTGTQVLWELAGSTIKRLRRTGKLQAEAASTAVDIEAIRASTVAALDAVVPPS